MQYRQGISYHLRKQTENSGRVTALAVLFCMFGAILIVRLFILMTLQHGWYTALAESSQDSYRTLVPQRGAISIVDSRTGEEFRVALNHDSFLVYANPRVIADDTKAGEIANQLAGIFQYDDKRKNEVALELQKRQFAYRPIEWRATEEQANRVRALNLTGVAIARRSDRYYPENDLAASVVGFVGKSDDGSDIGRYGVEGYWQKDLAGSGGFLAGARGPGGGWISLSGLTLQEAHNGADILLTIDRSLEKYACDRLRAGLKEYGAASASLVILDPTTGAVRAMCSIPDFSPSTYGQVSSPGVYNNGAIFTPYEPGSIFKPIGMAGALNDGVITPETTFVDTGSRTHLCKTPIRNAGDKSYGLQTMTGVLQNSINTGMVFVVEQLKKKKFREYVEQFGFGTKEGIQLDTESAGTIESLSKNSGDALDCYAATGSFGQGLTVTPLQMAAAFGALANGGVFLRPYIIQEVRYADGRVTRTRPEVVRQVVSRRTATLISAMLTQVVDHGYGGRARVPGYAVAGKSGTAQIPGPGGYTSETNHSFIGFAPAEQPKFVMIVKYEKPQRTYAEVTAAPVFADIAKFILHYYEIPPTRSVAH